MFGAEGGLVTLAGGDKKKTRDLAKASQPTWSTMMMKLLTINMIMILIKMATKKSYDKMWWTKYKETGNMYLEENLDIYYI